MGHRFSEIAFTPAVKKVQEEMGSRKGYARFEGGDEPRNHILGPEEVAFVGQRDSFYMATVSETGWPYIQHRGGPPGFVRVLDEHTLGVADFRGNRQYISVGNLATDPRAALFFMDYPNRTRLKVLGRVGIVDPADEATMARLVVPGYDAKVERGFLIRVEAFDWNCPQHITQRFTLAEIEAVVGRLQDRIIELEGQLAARTGAEEAQAEGTTAEGANTPSA